MQSRNNISHITTMNVFGATRESRNNIIISDLIASNKLFQQELTSHGLLIEKNTVYIKSLHEKLDNLTKQVSALIVNDDKNKTILYDLNNRLNSMTNPKYGEI